MRTELLVHDGLVRAIEKGRDLGVGDAAVPIQIRRAVQTRAHFMTEDAGLEGAPLVAFVARRRGKQEPKIVPPSKLRGCGKPLHLAPFAAGTALAHEQIGVASVHDEVVLVSADGVKNFPCQLIPGQARVL